MESLSVGPLLVWLTFYLLTHVERMCWVFLCAQNLLSKDLSDKKIGMASHSSSWPSDPPGRISSHRHQQDSKGFPTALASIESTILVLIAAGEEHPFSPQVLRTDS